jgi:hypothetical protein
LTLVTVFGVATTLAAPRPASEKTPAKAVLLAPELADIVKMVKANVSPNVIIAYIQNSAQTYEPSAAEIAALTRWGVPEGVIQAVLEQDEGVRRDSSSGPMARLPRNEPSAAPAFPSLTYQASGQAYQNPYAGDAYYGNAYPGYAYGLVGPLISFNNSFPTYVRGYPVYSGYYVPGFGVLW